MPHTMNHPITISTIGQPIGSYSIAFGSVPFEARLTAMTLDACGLAVVVLISAALTEGDDVV